MAEKMTRKRQKNELDVRYHQLSYEMEQRLSNARVTITLDHPFFGYLLAGLEFKPKDIPGLTMATDGYMVIYSPGYAKQLSNDELLFVLCHEVLHCALEHVTRRKDRQPLIWNLAVDIVTNELLLHNKIGKQPDNTVRGKDWLPEEFYKSTGLLNKSAEEVYRELVKHVKVITIRLEGEGPFNFDQHYDPDDPLLDRKKEQSDLGDAFRDTKRPIIDWSAKLAQAAVFAKNKGKLPAGIEEEYEVAVKGHFPWQRMLAQYITQALAYDTSFSRPNRRYVSRNLYLPATEKSGINIAVAIDTSGSIGEEEAKVFISETFAILSQFQRVEITVIQCDAAVQEVKHYSNWDSPPSKFKLKGRGGTDFRPVFVLIENERLPIDVLIYLTDGYGTFPEKQPYQLPVFWVLTTRDVNPPFGRKIFFPPLSRF